MKFLVVLLVVSFGLFIVHLAINYVSIVIFEEKNLLMLEMSNRFDMNDENSVPQWFTLLGFLLLSAGSALSAYMSKDNAVRKLWVAIAVIALLFSIDDAAAIHESVLVVLHVSYFGYVPATLIINAWLLILPIVLIGLAVLLTFAFRLLPRRTIMRLALGAVTFLVGAILIDSLANIVPESTFMNQGVAAGFEGLLQLIGLSLLVYSIADYLENEHGKRIAAALRLLAK